MVQNWRLNMQDEKPYKILISFGETPNPPTEYAFQTEAELEAFTFGVSEAEGWLDYRIVDPEDAWVYALSEGDKVKWNDPDEGIGSRLITIKSIEVRKGEEVTITDQAGDEVGAAFYELEQVPYLVCETKSETE
jgi:hypothetical protein